jgi:hypothetical protein
MEEERYCHCCGIVEQQEGWVVELVDVPDCDTSPMCTRCVKAQQERQARRSSEVRYAPQEESLQTLCGVHRAHAAYRCSAGA